MKKILISTIAIVMAISMVFVFNDTSSAEPTSGECGENLTWTYDPDTTTLTISGEGTAIQDYASAGSPWHDLNVTNVVFDCPNLTTIGAYAFEDSNMSNHKLPYKITTINEGAFRNCYMLALEKLPDKLTTIGNGAFEHCIRLNIMTIPYGVTVLGPNVFKDCMGIHVMIIPDSITSIDNTAFEDTTGLTTVGNLSTVDISEIFPNMTHNLVVAGSGTYGTGINWYYFTELDTLFLNGNGTTTGDYYSSSVLPWDQYTESIKHISFECPNLITIGNYAFNRMTSLEEIKIPEGLTTLGGHTFDYSKITNLTIPESLATLGAMAFYGVNTLTTIEYNAINCNVDGGGYGCFYSSPIDTVIIGENVQKMGRYALGNDRTNVTLYFNAVHMDDLVRSQSFSINKRPVVTIFGDKVEYIPGDLLSGAGSYAQSVLFSDNIKEIGQYAFHQCSNLVVLSIPESVESIGTSAFAGCRNVMIRTLPEGVHLDPTAFQNCTGITSLVIPGEIGFGPNCFEGCTNLKQILNLSDMEIVAGSEDHGKVGYYADSVQDHIDGVAIVQDKEHVEHETVVDSSITSKLLRFVPVFVSLGLLLGAIAYMYVRRNEL